ncbi:MAG TPA: hypothetical protein VGC76_15565 [Pyrinomonadaceae bacterium]|jgi:hypothetical protein
MKSKNISILTSFAISMTVASILAVTSFAPGVKAMNWDGNKAEKAWSGKAAKTSWKKEEKTEKWADKKAADWKADAVMN